MEAAVLAAVAPSSKVCLSIRLTKIKNPRRLESVMNSSLRSFRDCLGISSQGYLHSNSVVVNDGYQESESVDGQDNRSILILVESRNTQLLSE